MGSDCEVVGCWVIERKNGEERYFDSLYPSLAEGDERVRRITIAFWEVA